MVDIEKLVVDGSNVREQQWDQDPEFITDVKTNEIMNPLLVRPLDNNKYGVVAGSRRFNAAIDAGLKQVPCRIEQMDDLTAYARSIAENHYIKDVETWMYAIQIGRMYAVVTPPVGVKCLTFDEKTAIICNKTGFGGTTVEDYLAISTLPPEVLELMKARDHRSKQVIEKLKQYNLPQTLVLDVHKAAYLARNLKGQSVDRIFESAVHAMSFSRDQAKELIDKVKKYDKQSPNDIANAMKQVFARMDTIRVILDLGVKKMVNDEAAKEHIEFDDLLILFIKEGLRHRGWTI